MDWAPELERIAVDIGKGRGTPEQLDAWAGALRRHPRRRALAVQLVALVVRLVKAGHDEAAKPFCRLAEAALEGAQALQRALEASGVGRHQARSLAKLEAEPSSLTSGLERPARRPSVRLRPRKPGGK